MIRLASSATNTAGVRPGITKVPGKDYRQPDGLVPPPCPPTRDEDAAGVAANKPVMRCG